MRQNSRRGAKCHAADTRAAIGHSSFFGDTEQANAIAIQSDGKIVVAGWAYDGGFVCNIAVARYNADGSLDTTFGGGDGMATYKYNSADTLGMSVGIDAGGGVVVGATDNTHFLLVRFDSSGNLDTTFGSSGVAVASFSASADATGMAIGADGDITVGGYIPSSGNIALARFDSTGALDMTFGSGGTQTASLSGLVFGLRLQNDGKAVVAGVSGGDFAVARFTIAGDLDTTFDTDGKLTTSLGGVDTAYGVTIGPDYKITVVGVTGNDFGVARYKVVRGLEERLYALTDANHNVTGVTDVFGIIKERFVYDPYGAATVLTAAYGSTTDSLSWVYRDQGLRYDSITNTLDNRNRIYFISLGRFGQNDIGYPDGANRYQREMSNPMLRVDPKGRSSHQDNLDQLATLQAALDSITNRLGAPGDPNNAEINQQRGKIIHKMKLRKALEDLYARRAYSVRCFNAQATLYNEGWIEREAHWVAAIPETGEILIGEEIGVTFGFLFADLPLWLFHDVWVGDSYGGVKRPWVAKNVHNACMNGVYSVWHPNFPKPPSLGTIEWLENEIKRIQKALDALEPPRDLEKEFKDVPWYLKGSYGGIPPAA